MLLKRYGTMTFKQVLEAAARVADQGFGITERIGYEWKGRAPPLLKADTESARVYLVDGEAPPLYSIFRNADVAKAFRTLQSGGRDAFYIGPIAQAIVDRSKALGGTFTMGTSPKVMPDGLSRSPVTSTGTKSTRCRPAPKALRYWRS